MKTQVIGLTGSIGMGKSTTAAMFAEQGIPVWSADEAVHRLYEKGGKAVARIAEVCPEAIVDGRVDREQLSAWIMESPGRLKLIEELVHPLVAADRKAFIEESDSDIVVADIPLLFETSAETSVDYVVVASTSVEEQRRRVLERPGMTPEKLDMILTKQVPDAEKRERADFLVETPTLEVARTAVQKIIEQIRAKDDA